MFEPDRHFTPSYRPWDEAEARAAIGEIAQDALSAFDPLTLWPAHPQDDDLEDGLGSVYFGAAGVIWALDHLARAGAIEGLPDLAPALAVALARNEPWYGATPYPGHASLLMGDLGIQLVQMRLKPDPGLADRIHAAIAANTMLPTLELMWGLPGSMLACLHMHGMTGEERFIALFREQARKLVGEIEERAEGGIWTQHLYGRHLRWLGAVHGFAGNMAPLLHGWAWLDEAQRRLVADAGARTFVADAAVSPLGANWPATLPAKGPPTLCQHCHGAAGMVTTFADAPFSTPAFEAALLQGGMLTWNAGPLKKGTNLCHGTGGNGYAFLKLHRRTGEVLWLERARAFAMTAIEQVRQARAEYGQGRYSLWTGDPGLAVYLWDCITGEGRFPTIDVM